MKIRLLSFALLINLGLFAQEFEGFVVYDLTYELSDEMQGYEAMLPKQTKMEYRGDISRSITESPSMGGSTIVLTNNETKETLTLLDNGGQKLALRSSFNQEEDETEYTETNEEKEILGYSCKVVEKKIQDAAIRICVTKELPVLNTESSRKVDGFPLQIEIEAPQMTKIQTVSEVIEGKIQKIKFEVPSGYKEMSIEEYQKSMMQIDQ